MEEKKVITGILRPDIELLRGDNLLLFDPGADAYYKVTPSMLKIMAFLTEELPLAEFQEKLSQNGITVSRQELLELIAFLRNNHLLVPRQGEISAKQQQLRQLKEKSRLLRFSASYLFFRLPPWRPEHFFEKIRPFVSFLASRQLLFLLVLPALAGYLLALRDLGEIRTTFADTLSWAGLVKYFAAILLLKLLHEAAHSLAAIHFNCRVRGVGIGFMVFMPRLYTDTTDSWRLPRKKRLLIDAAGIIAELLCGGIAALLWCNLAPGPLRSTMFYIFAVSTLSTLLVNGNPFIRYDGYYILSDLLHIENLMSRSAECFRKSWRWYLLRLGTPPEERHKLFLTVFGICAFVYRFFLYTSICLMIYHKFTKVLALFMLLLEFYALLIHPCYKELRTIWTLSRKSAGKALWFLLPAAGAAIAGVLFLPLSWGITLPGLVVPAERTPVTLEESGYLTGQFSRTPRPVKKGDLLLQLDSPRLDFALDTLTKTRQFDQLLYEQQNLDEEEFSKRNVTAQKISSDRIGLEELKRRRNKLQIRAGRDGIFIPSLPDSSAGALLPRNTSAGEIVSARTVIYAYADDRDIGKISPGNSGKIRLADTLGSRKVCVTRIDQIAALLESSPLLQNFGGPIPVYPAEDGKFVPAQTLYRVELDYADPSEPAFPAGRIVSVKIDHTEQLYKYAVRFVLSFFLKEF